MKVFLRNIDASGQPMIDEGQEFEGRTPLAIIRAIRAHSAIGSNLTPDAYMEATASTARRIYGVELDYAGDTPNKRARSFLNALVIRGWAEVLVGKPKGRAPDHARPVIVPKPVRIDIEELRDSGLMRMSDNQTVIEVSRAVGFLETANWIESNPERYRHGLKFGFVSVPSA